MIKSLWFLLFLAFIYPDYTSAQVPERDEPLPLGSLKDVPLPGPKPEEIAEIVQNKKVLVRLGKALFWDTKVGSDNKIACATCHFHAGADGRDKNQLNPGTPSGDNTFQFFKPNHRLANGEFPIPFRRFGDNFNDIVSSQGIFNKLFVSVDTTQGLGKEVCEDVPDPVFHAFNREGQALNLRQVEPRNTPSVINAVFNLRNFWDGRAKNTFNGIDPFGKTNQNSFVWKMVDGELKKVKVNLSFSSLASQASGPPLSGLEMSCRGRIFADIGRKLLRIPILSSQTISLSDSVLGPLAKNKPYYESLIKEAFKKEWWDSNKMVTFNAANTAIVGSMDHVNPPLLPKSPRNTDYSLMESNFSLFFGLAIQSYVSTLVSDDTRFDRHMEGKQWTLSAKELRGMKVFEGNGKCINCHSGAEFTNASVRNAHNQRLETMLMGDELTATYDNGFYNIGVRPTEEDLGVGGKDPFGYPLSEVLLVKNGHTDMIGDFDPEKEPKAENIRRVAIKGAFKTPSLRNVALTGPYFHNGGKASLMEVVEFYDRGGDFRKENHDDIDPDIRRLRLTDQEKEDLVSFMLSLTDDRVKYRRAPFDHPSICVPNGSAGNEDRVYRNGKTIRAQDLMRCIPAVGKRGSKLPLRPFLDVDHFMGEEFKMIRHDVANK